MPESPKPMSMAERARAMKLKRDQAGGCARLCPAPPPPAAGACCLSPEPPLLHLQHCVPPAPRGKRRRPGHTDRWQPGYTDQEGWRQGQRDARRGPARDAPTGARSRRGARRTRFAHLPCTCLSARALPAAGAGRGDTEGQPGRPRASVG